MSDDMIGTGSRQVRNLKTKREMLLLLLTSRGLKADRKCQTSRILLLSHLTFFAPKRVPPS
jgi:hypothetical protein